MLEKLLKYFPLVKIDEATHTVWGVVTSETPDSDNEICDYPAAKAAIKAWSDETFAKTTAAGQDPSLGNMRVMHQLEVGGKAIKIEYKDDSKQVWVGSEPANDDVWHLLKGGFLTAHSIGGSYAWKRKDGDHVRYAPTIGEISYVDKGANPDASFSYVKADGSTELRKFAKPGPEEEKILAKLKESQLTKLSDDDIDRIAKAISTELGTDLEKLRALVSGVVAKTTPATGADMKPEEIKKCAAALGISEEEFKKQFVAADALAKAKGGLAALHGHMETAMEHHEAMHKAHGAMGSMHEKMATHLGKCMKACKAVMGDDEKESEKALKALVDELKAGTEPPKKDEPETFTKAQAEALVKSAVDTAVADAVKKAIDALPAPPAAKVFSIDRDTGAAKQQTSDPLPV